MAPIRRGDGTGLSPKGIAEVRKGDGTVLYQSGTDIPDSAIAQYDASQLSGLSDGDTVTSFTDFEGSNDASATGTPTFKEGQQNGLPVVRYNRDGHHDTGITVDTTGAHSVIFAAKLNDTFGQSFYGKGDGNAGDNVYVGESTGGAWFSSYGDTPDETGDADLSPHIFSFVAGSGTATLYIDGDQVTSYSYTGVGSNSGPQYLGARNRPDQSGYDHRLDGDFFELLPYDAALSDNARQSEEQRLADKWGIVLDPPGADSWSKSSSNPVNVQSVGSDASYVFDGGTCYSVREDETASPREVVLYSASDPEGTWSVEGTVFDLGGHSEDYVWNPDLCPDGSGGYYIYWNNQAVNSNDAGDTVYWHHLPSIGTSTDGNGQTGITASDIAGSEFNEFTAIRDPDPDDTSRQYKALLIDNSNNNQVYAYSSDGGNWSVHGPVKTGTTWDGSDPSNQGLVKVGDYYIQYYVTTGNTAGLGKAWSLDMTDWTEIDNNPALDNSGGSSFDDTTIHGPDVAQDDAGQWALFWPGNDGSEHGVAFASEIDTGS